MKTIQFRGSSDDTFGWSEIRGGRERGGDDHDDCAGMSVRAFRVASESTGQAVIVTGVYGQAPAGVWSVGLAPDDEDIAIPPWAASPHFRTEGYSVALTLDVPDDTTIKLVCVGGEKR